MHPNIIYIIRGSKLDEEEDVEGEPQSVAFTKYIVANWTILCIVMYIDIF